MTMDRTRNLVAFATDNLGEEKADEAEDIGSLFDNLPFSVVTHILLQLTIRYVCICKCVCKTWNTLISDPYFVTLHFERAPKCFMIRTGNRELVSRTLHLFEPGDFDNQLTVILEFNPKFKLPLRSTTTKLVLDDIHASKPEDDTFDVVNSCNGLLCLCDPMSEDHFVVCNPITGEFIRLPEFTNTFKSNKTTRESICAGLGFQPKRNEYKVIRMWKICVERLESNPNTHVVVEMHTLGTSTWRRIVAVDNRLSSFSKLEFPTCVNGALHWINFDGRIWSIIAFNFESERLESFPSPPDVNEKVKCKEQVSMAEVNDFLYICDASAGLICTVWVMKKYGIGESWTKVFSTDNLGGLRGPCICQRLCWPVKHVGNRVGLLVQKCNSWHRFIYFEPEKHGCEWFHLTGPRFIRSFQVFPHTPSLISLKDVVKTHNIEVFNVRSRCAKLKLSEEHEVRLSLTRFGQRRRK